MKKEQRLLLIVGIWMMTIVSLPIRIYIVAAEHRRQNVPPPPPPIVDRPPIGQRNAQTNEPQLIINVPRTKEGLELRTPFADVRQWYHRNLSFLRVGFRKYINKTVPMDNDKTPSQRYRDYSVATKYCKYEPLSPRISNILINRHFHSSSPIIGRWVIDDQQSQPVLGAYKFF